MTFNLEPYTHAMQQLWDTTVDASRNGTFMLRRGFMDYHADRFADRSLIIRDDKGNAAALFAAAESRASAPSDTVTAHAGLTYGGLILPYGTCGAEVLDIMEQIAAYWRSEGKRRIVYRAIPHIYHRFPAEEDIYAIFRLGGRLTECSLSAAYEAPATPPRNQNTRRNIARATKNGITVAESTDIDAFHTMLTQNLAERHSTAPVHTAAELKLLADRFPANIRLWTAHSGHGDLLAGTLMFVTPTCAHAQYIASTPTGRELRAPAALFDTVMAHYAAECRYFDFGISCEEHGRYLNTGLLHQKCGFGARGIAYSTYEIPL